MSGRNSSAVSRISKISKIHVEDDFRETEDSVNYESTNKAEQTKFVAVSPANSIHAAKLAQIAMAVQTRQSPRQPDRRVKALASNVVPRAQIQAVAYQDDPQGGLPHPAAYASSQQSYHSQDPEYPTTQQPYEQQPSYHQASATDYYEEDVEEIPFTAPSQPRLSVLPAPTALPSRTPYVPPAPPQVFRQTSEQKTSYQVRGQNGKLQVSAPVGSDEAQLFDEVARMNAQPKVEDRSDQKLVRKSHHHSSKHKERRGCFGF